MASPQDAQLTEAQTAHFAEHGFVVIPGLVSDGDCKLADTEVGRLLDEEPPSQDRVGSYFIWRHSHETPTLFSLLHRPFGIMDVAAELVRPNRIEVAFDQVQVALNIPPYDHHPGRPHIDGYAADQVTPGTFTMLAGLLLTDQLSDNAGNLWVWPGTHKDHAAFFAREGATAFADSQGYPDIEPGEPVQIHGQRGDVIFAHYLLGHNIGGNFQSVDTRKALYWRLQVPGHAASWYSSLSDPWHEFPILARSAMKLDANHT